MSTGGGRPYLRQRDHRCGLRLRQPNAGLQEQRRQPQAVGRQVSLKSVVEMWWSDNYLEIQNIPCYNRGGPHYILVANSTAVLILDSKIEGF